MLRSLTRRRGDGARAGTREGKTERKRKQKGGVRELEGNRALGVVV